MLEFDRSGDGFLNRVHDFIISSGRVIPLSSGMLWLFAGRRITNNAFFPIGEEALPYVLVSATLITFGNLADTLTTLRTLKSENAAKSMGANVNIKELNPLLSNNPSIKEILARRLTFLDAACIAFGTAIPTLGISLGMAKFSTSIKNELINRYLQRKIAAREDAVG